jgi:hypothetical protein
MLFLLHNITDAVPSYCSSSPIGAKMPLYKVMHH